LYNVNAAGRADKPIAHLLKDRKIKDISSQRTSSAGVY